LQIALLADTSGDKQNITTAMEVREKKVDPVIDVEKPKFFQLLRGKVKQKTPKSHHNL